MNKSLLFGSLASLALLLVSCSDEINDQPQQETPDTNVVTLQGSFGEKKFSRSAVYDNGEFSWLPGDKIKVLSTDGNFYEFSFDGKAPSATGTFSGDIRGIQTKYAISPASIAPGSFTEGSTLFVYLPESFTSEEKQSNAPMLATFAEGGTSLQFKNLAGLMKVNVLNLPANVSLTLSVTANNRQLWGTFDVVQDGEDGDLIISTREWDSYNNVTIGYSSEEKGHRAFYIPLPVGQYDEIKVELLSSEGEWFSKRTRLNVGRNKLFIMPTITCGTTPNTKQEVISAESDNVASGINDILEATTVDMEDPAPVDLNITVAAANTSVETEEEEMTSTVEIKQEVVIPEKITNAEPVAEQKPTVSLTFDAVPVTDNVVTTSTGEEISNIITITDQPSDNGGEDPDAPGTGEDPENPEGPIEEPDQPKESKSEVQIYVPAIVETTTEEVKAPSFNINLPSSTVTLSANGTEAKYDVVIANTAENTLRVDKGVTINRVIVGTGNVLLKGTINQIETGSSKMIYVTLEPGAVLNGTIPSNVIIIDNRYASEDGQIAHAFANESVADGIKVPYEINDISQLRLMSLRVNGGHENENMIPYYKCNYKLTSDIMVGTVADWCPIGSEGAPFRGMFDGCNHVVHGNFNFVNGIQFAGLFGYLQSATIKNVVLEGLMSYQHNGDSYHWNPRVGGIAGYITNGSVIEHCINKAVVKYADIASESYYYAFVGGIVGESSCYNGVKNTIVACGNEGQIDCERVPVSGIVSYSYNTDILLCYNTAEIPSSHGICNDLQESTMKGCWSEHFSFICPNESSSLVSNCYMGTYEGINNGNVLVNCGIFTGTTPSKSQIADMNNACVSTGWMFDENAKLVKSDKSGIPDAIVRPW